MPEFSIIYHQCSISLRNQLRTVAHQCGIYVFLSYSATRLCASSPHQRISRRTLPVEDSYGHREMRIFHSIRRRDLSRFLLPQSSAISSCMQDHESGNSSTTPRKEIRKAWTHAAASIALAGCRRWSSARGAPLPSTSDHSGERRPSSTRTSLAAFLDIPNPPALPLSSRTPHDLLTRIPLRTRKQTLGGKRPR